MGRSDDEGFDSDEEELKQLRQSNRYTSAVAAASVDSNNIRPTSYLTKPVSTSNGKEGNSLNGPKTQPLPPVPRDEEDEEDEESAQMRAVMGMPMTFGKGGSKQKTMSEIHDDKKIHDISSVFGTKVAQVGPSRAGGVFSKPIVFKSKLTPAAPVFEEASLPAQAPPAASQPTRSAVPLPPVPTFGSSSSSSSPSKRLGTVVEKRGRPSDEEEEEDGPGPMPASSSYNGYGRLAPVEEEEEGDTIFIPHSHKVDVAAHSKSVSALSLNPKGSRMLTGGYDYQVRLWDFNGMTAEKRSMRQLEPLDGHAIQALCFSCTGSHFICAPGEAIVKLYDGEAKPLIDTIKGDMYIRDTANTKGHTHMVTEVQWHPLDRETFMSASMDATIRLWDVNATPTGVDLALPHLHCLKAVDKRGLNISNCHVCCATYSPDGKHIVAGCVDGSIQMFHERKKYTKPDKIVRDQHKAEVSNITFLRDSVRFVSRAVDCTMKLWDVRKLGGMGGPATPLQEYKGLPSNANTREHQKTQVAISPDQSIVFTATGTDKSGTLPGALQFYHVDSPDPIYVLPLARPTKDGKYVNVTGVRMAWHEELDQIIVGLSDGTVQLVYDPLRSKKGALLFVGREAAKKVDDFLGFVQPVFTPQELKEKTIYKETPNGLLRKVKGIHDKQQKTIVPPRPMGKMGAEGQVAQYGNLSEFIAGKLNKSMIHEEDPVEVLRKYAEKNGTDPGFMGAAYAKSQPVPVFDTSEEGEGEQILHQAAKCPRCGLKMCKCGYLKTEQLIKGPPTKQRKVG